MSGSARAVPLLRLTEHITPPGGSVNVGGTAGPRREIFSDASYRTSSALAAFTAAFSFAAARAQAAGGPIFLQVDTTAAPAQNVVTTHEVIPVQPGKLTLYYPKWLPGQHQPVGPVANMAGLTIKAGGATLPWRREPTDLYAIDVDVPAGVNAIDVT